RPSGHRNRPTTPFCSPGRAPWRASCGTDRDWSGAALVVAVDRGPHPILCTGTAGAPSDPGHRTGREGTRGASGGAEAGVDHPDQLRGDVVRVAHAVDGHEQPEVVEQLEQRLGLLVVD